MNGKLQTCITITTKQGMGNKKEKGVEIGILLFQHGIEIGVEAVA